MASTPEGKVKIAVKKVLTDSKQWGYIYYNFPVPAGYGTPMLDVVGCYHGRFFAIELKAPGKKPTPRQNLCISQMREAGGIVFVIDNVDGTGELETWLDAVRSGTDKHAAQANSNTE